MGCGKMNYTIPGVIIMASNRKENPQRDYVTALFSHYAIFGQNYTDSKASRWNNEAMLKKHKDSLTDRKAKWVQN